MDQQQENNYGSRRWMILGPFLTDLDIQTPFSLVLCTIQEGYLPWLVDIPLVW